MTNFTDRVILRLNGSIPVIEQLDAVKKIWWFEDGKWVPQGFTDDLVDVDSYLTLTNYNNDPPSSPLNLFEITIQGTGGEPIMVTDRGFMVKKDITAGGFVGSNQGELWLGSGRDDQVDVPKIILTHSDVSRLEGGGLLDVPGIPEYSYFPAGENGQLFIYTPTSILYKHNGSTWDPLGPISNYAGYFDTLYITKSNGEDPANLDVGDISIHGHLGVGDTVTSDLNPNPDLDLGSYSNPWASVVTSSLWVKSPNTQFGVSAGDEWNGSGYDAYLHPQNPANGGLGLGTANYPFKWVDATYVFTNGINVLSGDTLNVNGNLAIVNNSASPEIKISSTKSVKLTLEADTDNATETDQPLLFFSQDSGIVTASIGFLNGENAFSIMQHYGDSLKLGTNNAVRATITSAGQLQLAVSGSSGGLKIGDDVNLYRSAQDVLKTDDSFVCSNISGNDAVFNSVKGTYSGAAVKAGDYITLSWDATNSNITAHNRHMKLNTDSGKDVIVARDLNVLGVAKTTGYVNTSPSVSWMNGSRTFNTVYQNTTGKTILVQVAIGVAGVGQPFYTDMYLAIGSTANPTHMVNRSSNSINSVRRQLTAVVPAGWYYKLYRNPNDDNYVWMGDWYEQVL
jgi:hypothetical protein